MVVRVCEESSNKGKKVGKKNHIMIDELNEVERDGMDEERRETPIAPIKK